MKRLFFLTLLVLTTISVLVWKLYSSLMVEPAKKQGVAAKATPTPKPVREKAKVEVHAPTIRRELFCFLSKAGDLGHVGPTYLRTDHAEYYEGELCEWGLVEAIRVLNRLPGYAVIRLRQGDEMSFVVCGSQKPLEEASERFDSTLAANASGEERLSQTVPKGRKSN